MSLPFRNLLAAASAAVVLGQGASAMDITVFDKRSQFRSTPGSNAWWGDGSLAPGVQHPDPRGAAEDNETEPGTLIGQEWDLEAFLVDGMTLSLVGGFHFMAGQGTYASGDIFIDVDGDADWGMDIGGGSTVVRSNSLFKFDYVIDLEQTVNANFDSTLSSIGLKYTVYKIDATADQVISVAVVANAESNPWIYHTGGEAIAGHVDRDITAGYFLGGDYEGWGANDTHHMLQFDLGFLGSRIPTGTVFKFTMECGNDNLVGQYLSLPESGQTLGMVSVGLAMIGGAQFRRWKRARRDASSS